MNSAMWEQPEQETQVGERRRAKFKGICARTGITFTVGEEIIYDHVGWGRVASVAGLEPVPENTIYFQEEYPIRVRQHVHGEVLREPRKPLDAPEPRVLFVLGCHVAYYAEGTYVYTTVCRLASEEEAAPVIAREHAEATAGEEK